MWLTSKVVCSTIAPKPGVEILLSRVMDGSICIDDVVLGLSKKAVGIV
jgi:hypothetical protein